MTKLLKNLPFIDKKKPTKTNGHMKTLNVFFRYVTSFTTCITSFREWNRPYTLKVVRTEGKYALNRI